MKTKKFFLLLAAVLLGSVSAFAQSGNNDPQKGDVNEDGVVDIADVVAVLGIMKDGGGTATTTYYWYVGTTKPTSLSQAEVVTEYQSEYTYTNNSGDWSKIYVLVNNDKNVTMIDPSLGGIVDQDDVDTTTIPGYKIFSTYSPWANGSSIKIRITDNEQTTYYWYVGQTDPSTMTEISPIVDDLTSPGWRLIGTTLPNYSSSNMLWDGANNNISFSTRDYYYLALPSNSLELYNSGGDNEMDGCTSLGTKVINNITYYVYKRNVKALAFGFNIY